MSLGNTQDRLAAAASLGKIPAAFVAQLFRLVRSWNDDPALNPVLTAYLDAAGAARPTLREPLPDGAVERYPILQLLGRGAHGSTYMAVQVAMRRLVALKVVPAPAGDAGEWLRATTAQVQATARAWHPNLVGVLDCQAGTSSLGVVLELVDGLTFAHLMREQKPLSWGEAVSHALGVARGLAALHRIGLAHGGLAPGSIYLDRHGQVKIEGTRFPPVPGQSRSLTDPYRAPEREGDALPTLASDLYALGAVLHHLLDGSPLSGGGSPKRWQEVPADLNDLVEFLLARTPGDRPQSIDAVVAELEVLASKAAFDRVPAVPESQAGISRRVLVVDDEPTVIALLEMFLLTAGYQVTSTRSVEAARGILEGELPDIVVTDIMFPGGDSGLDLAAWIQEKRLPVRMVAITSSPTQDVYDRLLSLGVSVLLPKPLERQTVLSCVHRALRGMGKSILVVDDNRLMRLILARMFVGESYQVHVASTHEEATALFDEHRPDLILADLDLKETTGIQLLEHVRRVDQVVKFIVLSAKPDMDSVIRALRLKAADVLIKSENTQELVDAVAAALK
jgi:CheY-like chemotaxis protein